MCNNLIRQSLSIVNFIIHFLIMKKPKILTIFVLCYNMYLKQVYVNKIINNKINKMKSFIT